jgi:uncharacterized caspase-like protein
MMNNFVHGYALLIGVGDSAYPNWSLPVTVKDVQALQAILIDTNLCAYPNDTEHIRLLKDAQATRQAILDSMDWLASQASLDPDATIILYYSGHGWLDPSTQHYYLIPHDIEPFDIASSAVTASEFTKRLHRISARQLLVFIDSCHAEGMATTKEVPTIKLPSGLTQTAIPKSLVDNLKQGTGRAVLTSSRGTQSSWVRPDGSLSLYTYHLIEALQGAGNQPGDTVVRVSNLMNHLGKTVPESARTLCQAEQTPFFDTATEDFAVALLRGGKGLPSGGWEDIQQEAKATMRRVVSASGKPSVAIDGSVSGSTIITGDHNQTK